MTLRFPGADGGAEERQYSVWRSNAQAGTLDVCVVLHELGPGSRWAGRCAAGDSVAILLSRALPIALDTSARAHVILGDETSIASAEAIIRATLALDGFNVMNHVNYVSFIGNLSSPFFGKAVAAPKAATFRAV